MSKRARAESNSRKSKKALASARINIQAEHRQQRMRRRPLLQARGSFAFYNFLLMPHARTTHHLAVASKMANNPGTTKTNPHNVSSQTMMPAMRHSAPMTPRAIRPWRSKLGRKNLLMHKNIALRLPKAKRVGSGVFIHFWVGGRPPRACSLLGI